MKITFEFFKKDKRTKSGLRHVKTKDYNRFHDMNEAKNEANLMMEMDSSIHIDVYETMVERVNLMTNEIYLERYDTSAVCSPSREQFWAF